jgi:hypothetical protein
MPSVMGDLRKLISDQANRRQDTMRGVIIAVNLAARTAHVKIKRQNSTGVIKNRGVAYLSYPADVGQNFVYLSKTDGFVVGDQVSLSSGLSNQETFQVVSIEETTYIYLNAGDSFSATQFGKAGNFDYSSSDTSKGTVASASILGSSLTPPTRDNVKKGDVIAGPGFGPFIVSASFTDTTRSTPLPPVVTTTAFYTLDPLNPLNPAPITGSPYAFRKVTLSAPLAFNHPKKAAVISDRVGDKAESAGRAAAGQSPVYFLPGTDAAGNPIQVAQNLNSIAQTDSTGKFLANNEQFMILKDVPLLSVGGSLSYAKVGLPILLGFAGGNNSQYSIVGPSGLLDDFSEAADRGGNSHSLRIDVDEMIAYVYDIKFGLAFTDLAILDTPTAYALVKNGVSLKTSRGIGPYFDGILHLEPNKYAEIAIKFVIRSNTGRTVARNSYDPLLSTYKYISRPTSYQPTAFDSIAGKRVPVGSPIPVVFNRQGVPVNNLVDLTPLSPNPFDPANNPYSIQASSTNLGRQGIPVDPATESYTLTNQGFSWRAWRYDPNWPIPVLKDFLPRTVINGVNQGNNHVGVSGSPNDHPVRDDYFFNTSSTSPSITLSQDFTRNGQLPFECIDPMHPLVTHIRSKQYSPDASSSDYGSSAHPLLYNIEPILQRRSASSPDLITSNLIGPGWVVNGSFSMAGDPSSINDFGITDVGQPTAGNSFAEGGQANELVIRVKVDQNNSSLHGSIVVHATRYRPIENDTPYNPDFVLDMIKNILVKADANPAQKIWLINNTIPVAERAGDQRNQQLSYSLGSPTPIMCTRYSFSDSKPIKNSSGFRIEDLLKVPSLSGDPNKFLPTPNLFTVGYRAVFVSGTTGTPDSLNYGWPSGHNNFDSVGPFSNPPTATELIKDQHSPFWTLLPTGASGVATVLTDSTSDLSVTVTATETNNVPTVRFDISGSVSTTPIGYVIIQAVQLFNGDISDGNALIINLVT